MTWVHNAPVSGGRWDLVQTHARRLGVLTKHLLQELRRVGAEPKFIGNAWMIRAAEFADVEHQLKCLSPANTKQRLDLQAQEIADLRAKLCAMEAVLAASANSTNQSKE